MSLILEDREVGLVSSELSGSKIEACESCIGFAAEVERYKRHRTHFFKGAIV